MKTSQLKHLIKEAVREAIREELGATQQQTPVQEAVVNPPMPTPAAKTGNALLDALNETKHTLSSDEYKNLINANSSMVSAPGLGMQSNTPSGPMPGLDLSQLDFTKKAGAIFKKSNEISSNR